ncbi:MAG: DUF4421 family protein, partial [Prevotellaceae bacterium]|nr:DUF4421 family protein [Prevotellaceae bacterium]
MNKRTSRRLPFLLLLLAMAMTTTVALANDERGDSIHAPQSSALGTIKKTVRGFSAIDTNYIEPQHYNYALMVQTTYNYDMYWLRSNNGQEVMFSPDLALRVGPYFG